MCGYTNEEMERQLMWIRIHIVVLLWLVIPSGTLRGQTADYIQLEWSDEFNVDGAPDPTNWGYDIGTGDNGWGNREVQYYTDESNNVRVENGRLIIDARKSGNTWTSARLKSQGKQSFQYGKVVFRAKLPSASSTCQAL